MLTSLKISNYALIHKLNMEPSKGLTMITGETGAGKSIMLGAVGLLLGNRADTTVLLNKEVKCIVEGEFDVKPYNLKSWFESTELDYEDTSIIRREISPAGKSRAFINDTPVNLQVLMELGIRLMDIHSQHETLQLGTHRFQRSFIDSYASNQDLYHSYQEAFKTYRTLDQRLLDLKGRADQIEQEADYNNFLLEELMKANLDADEQDKLEQDVKVAENAEEIKLKLNEILSVLRNSEYSVENGIQQAQLAANQIAKLSDRYDSIRDRLSGLVIELQDLIREVEAEEEGVDFDPSTAKDLQDRLSMIFQLQHKHKVNSIEELLEIQSQLSDSVSLSQNLDEEIEKLQLQRDQALENVMQIGGKLSSRRKEASPNISSHLMDLLSELGMPNAAIEIEILEKAPGLDGLDQINILFSANKGISPEELSKVASGGEFTRLMFAIKYIMADTTALPTIVFDEIDTGVSGEIANKLGLMMKELSSKHQVIAISHLPQIAAKGSRHYFVFKDSDEDITVSRIRELRENDRVLEIAKMIGGDNPSDSALESAKEMMR